MTQPQFIEDTFAWKNAFHVFPHADCCCFQYAGDNPDCPIHGRAANEHLLSVVLAHDIAEDVIGVPAAIMTPADLAQSDDPRTPEQRDADQWQAETIQTRESDRPF